MATATKAPTRVDSVTVPTSKVKLHPSNKRTITNPEADKELLASIKLNGQLQACVARKGTNGQYELLAGARRLRACEKADMCIRLDVGDYDDDEALAIVQIENDQREGFHPFDQALSIEKMLARPDTTLETVAKRLGLDVGSVARRARLTKLNKQWRKVVLDESLPHRLLTAEHLEHVARLDDAGQAAVLSSIEKYPEICTWPLAKWKEKVSAWVNPLKHAPWSQADETLDPKAGPCTTCPKRAGNDALWDDMNLGNKGGCMDKACYANKMKLHVQRVHDELAAQEGQPKPIFIMNVEEGISDCAPGCEQIQTSEDIVQYDSKGKLKTFDKPGKGRTPAVLIADESPGKVVYVKTIDEAEPRRPDASDPAAETEKPKAPATLAEKREKLDLRRKKWVIDQLRKWIDDNLIDSLGPADKIEAVTAISNRHTFDFLLTLLVSFGCQRRLDNRIGDNKVWDIWDMICAKTGFAADPKAEAIKLLAGVWHRRLDTCDLADVAGAWNEVEYVADVLHMKQEVERWVRQAEIEIPEPKSWNKNAPDTVTPAVDSAEVPSPKAQRAKRSARPATAKRLQHKRDRMMQKRSLRSSKPTPKRAKRK